MMKIKKRKGVTLIELVMVITIVGVLVGVSSMYIKETINLWQFLTFRNEVVSQVRMAVSRMTRELRQVKDYYSIYSASATAITFEDVNDNNITFQLSSGNLLRNSDILVSGVGSFNLTYYDLSNNLIGSPAVSPYRTDIRRIKIRLGVSSGTQTKVLETQVYPRNLY